jgi:predicted RNA binding protein YcfA (HicA-like mRNA interferase family)
MSRREKLIERIKTRPPEADFSDVEKLLLEFGYQRKGQRGSHVGFKKPGAPTITIALAGGKKVKRFYLNMLCELLGLDD